ncbi:histidine kinase [Actinoplanes sp. NEAU-A12]|uniref:histidine kinase n=1 Tax=Actinoplanes sandaracinus TaxID=3045177 RepID=A0ABT6WC59_9ACTN|nr:histidine kinase [Actinoplanes sandaracinus]MDI6097308.1 histidine kinase [Actinoplanes sandaracinus]
MTGFRSRDVAGALAPCSLLIAWTRWAAPHMPAGRAIDAIAYSLVAVNAVALACRRAAPRRVLAVTTVVSTAYMFLAYPYGPALLPFAIAVYTVARHLPWRTAAIAAGAALPVLASHNVSDGVNVSDLLGVFPASGWVVMPFALGSTLALRRASVARDRREAIERGVHEERLRMAQEVHDIVGHGLAAIKMQADIALHVLAKQPGVARPTQEAISTTSALRIRVTSAFREMTPLDGGTGIAGMCERIATLGGRLTAGPAPDARFIVDAWLPAVGTP